MSKIERIEALKSKGSADVIPRSFWRHFYLHERNAQDLARTMLSFQDIYGWDFMKVNPRSCYFVEDWGVRIEYGGDEHTAQRITDHPVKSAGDWKKIAPLDVTKGTYGEHLDALKLIKKGLGEPVYFIMTVFTPLSVAGRLTGGNEQIKKFMDENPSELLSALEVITKTLIDFAGACLEVGAGGVFLATTTYGSTDYLTEEQFDRFSRPFDLRILDAVKDAPFNVLHVCQANNMLMNLLDYPVHAFNWDVYAEGNPSLAEVRSKTDRILIGGLSQDGSLLDEDDKKLEKEFARGVEQTDNGRRFILGAGCVISTRTRDAKLLKVKELGR